MDVHDQYTVNTDIFQDVGNHSGRDGDAGGTRAAILTGVAEIRDTGGNAFGRSAFQGIDHQNDFHEVIVGGSAGGLDDKDILAANVFIDFDSGFAVREFGNECFTERKAEFAGNLGSQSPIGVASEDH